MTHVNVPGFTYYDTMSASEACNFLHGKSVCKYVSLVESVPYVDTLVKPVTAACDVFGDTCTVMDLVGNVAPCADPQVEIYKTDDSLLGQYISNTYGNYYVVIAENPC